MAAAIGGTVSARTGGKFVSGAVTAAVQHWYNQERGASAQEERPKVIHSSKHFSWWKRTFRDVEDYGYGYLDADEALNAAESKLISRSQMYIRNGDGRTFTFKAGLLHMRITIHKIWIPLFVFFIMVKLLSKKYEPEQLAIASIFFVTSVFWFVAPYILGENIKVPSYTDVLKKGENDVARMVCFIVGLIGFIVSLLV